MIAFIYFEFFTVLGKKKFKYRGCGFQSIDATSWTEETKKWILTVNDLFSQLFGGDFLLCRYNADHGTKVEDEVVSGMFEYNHEEWETQYAKSIIDHREMQQQSPASTPKDGIQKYGHPRASADTSLHCNEKGNDLSSKEEIQKFCRPLGSADTNLQCHDTGK